MFVIVPAVKLEGSPRAGWDFVCTAISLHTCISVCSLPCWLLGIDLATSQRFLLYCNSRRLPWHGKVIALNFIVIISSCNTSFHWLSVELQILVPLSYLYYNFWVISQAEQGLLPSNLQIIMSKVWALNILYCSHTRSFFLFFLLPKSVLSVFSVFVAWQCHLTDSCSQELDECCGADRQGLLRCFHKGQCLSCLLEYCKDCITDRQGLFCLP